MAGGSEAGGSGIGGSEIGMLRSPLRMAPARETLELDVLFVGAGPASLAGAIHLGNVEEYARTGVAAVAVGAITHSAPALDISFELSA